MTIESVSTSASPTAELLLREVGARGASGVLEVRHPDGSCSHVWVRAGRIYAMQVPGYRPALGIRLLSGGLVTPEQLSAAAALQREQHPTMLIGQVLVGLGHVAPEVVTTFAQEQVLDQVADLLDLPIQSAAFHAGRRVQHDVIEPTEVDTLLAVARERREQRADVLAAVGGRHAVPQLGAPGGHPSRTPLGPYDWALLCRVDGRRDITELARVCGYTLQEAAQIVADLTLTGLLQLPEPPRNEEPLATVLPLRPGTPPAEPEDPQWRFDGTDAGEPEPVAPGTAALEGGPEDGPSVAANLLAELSAFVHDEPPPAVLVDAVRPPAPEALAEPAGIAVDPSEAAGPVTVPPPCEAPVEAQPAAAAPLATELAAPASDVLPSAAADAVPAPLLSEPPALEPVAAEPPAPEPVGSDTTAEPGTAATMTAEPIAAEPMTTEPMTTEPVAAEPMTAEPTAAEPTAAEPPAPPMFPAGAPVGPPTEPAYQDTSVFMRELSSLSDAPANADAPVVTRMVVPFAPTPRKRRLWGR
jgi:hypothetical protein